MNWCNVIKKWWNLSYHYYQGSSMVTPLWVQNFAKKRVILCLIDVTFHCSLGTSLLQTSPAHLDSVATKKLLHSILAFKKKVVFSLQLQISYILRFTPLLSVIALFRTSSRSPKKKLRNRSVSIFWFFWRISFQFEISQKLRLILVLKKPKE